MVTVSEITSMILSGNREATALTADGQTRGGQHGIQVRIALNQYKGTAHDGDAKPRELEKVG